MNVVGEHVFLVAENAIKGVAEDRDTAIDANAREIVGWRVSTTAHAEFILDTLKQTVHDMRAAKSMGFIHRSDR